MNLFSGHRTAATLYKGTPVDNNPELKQILIYLDTWERLAAILRALHITLGVIAIFFSLLTAVQIGAIQDQYSKIFAFIAAVTVAFMTGFNLTDKSNNVRTAWRELNAGVLQYNNHNIDEKELIEKYRQQEEKIGGVIFSKS